MRQPKPSTNKLGDDFHSGTTDWLGVVVAAAIIIIAVMFFAVLAFSAEHECISQAFGGIVSFDCSMLPSNVASEAVTEHKRDPAIARAYLKSNNLTRTPKGCQVDHVIPLHCGGPDIVENLQLICGPSLKAKEKYERNCETFKEWSKQCLVLQ